MIRSFKDLEVYKESYELAITICKSITRLPSCEKFNLVDQMRRASRSIPTNIAEGYAKRLSVKEFRKYLFTSLGSCNEMLVHLGFVKDLGYWKSDFCENLLDRYEALGKKINKLMQNWTIYPTSKI